MHFLYLFFLALVFGMIYIHLRFTMNLSRRRWIRLGMLALILSVVLGTFLYFRMRWMGVSGTAVTLLAWYVYTGSL